MNTILIAVATIESVAELLMGFRTAEGKVNTKLVIAMVIGVTVAILIPDFDVYRVAGIDVVPPIAGRILTGILASRGAKLFHDFLAIVESYKTNLKSR